MVGFGGQITAARPIEVDAATGLWCRGASQRRDRRVPGGSRRPRHRGRFDRHHRRVPQRMSRPSCFATPHRPSLSGPSGARHREALRVVRAAGTSTARSAGPPTERGGGHASAWPDMADRRKVARAGPRPHHFSPAAGADESDETTGIPSGSRIARRDPSPSIPTGVGSIPVSERSREGRSSGFCPQGARDPEAEGLGPVSPLARLSIQDEDRTGPAPAVDRILCFLGAERVILIHRRPSHGARHDPGFVISTFDPPASGEEQVAGMGVIGDVLGALSEGDE